MSKNNLIYIHNIKETAALIVLDSIELEKTLAYHDLFLLWEPLFKKNNIPIYIIFPDTAERLRRVCQTYHTNLKYISNPDLIHLLDCEKEKMVYGKKYAVILPKMYVIHEERLLCEQKRINNNTIKELYIKALELKFEKYIKKIKNCVDIQNILW